jgi:hypothetical protein
VTYPYRILVTGSREWADHQLIHNVLSACRAGVSEMVIVHGVCPHGADAVAQAWCERHGVPSELYPADWARLGKAAGHARNQVMIDKGADVCYAFYWEGAVNSGTADCVARAEAAGISVRKFYGGP